MRTEPTADDLLDLFPPGSRLDGDGTLMVGGCRLDDVAAEFGTPAIVVAEDALRQRARDYLAAFRGRWPRSDVAFASKSFPCTAVQRVMVEEGLHLDVAGGGEILTALEGGRRSGRLVLHGNAKTDEELELAVENGVGLVVVDNFDDIDRLERIVPAGPSAALPGPGHPRRRGRHPRVAGDRPRRLEVRPAARRRARRDRADRAQPKAAARRRAHPRRIAAAQRRPAGRRRSNRSRSSAPSTSTTSAAASACATPTTSTRPASTTTPTRW